MTADFRLTEMAAAKRRPRRAQRNGRVTVVRVAPLAMRVALELADGDSARIRVLGPAEVLVVNGAARGQAARWRAGAGWPVR